MRILGIRSWLLLAATLTLAACGGESDTASSSGNQPPVIQGTPTTELTSGQTYSFQPTAADPDGDTLTFSATNLPGWASINTQTGRITGTPTESDVGMSQPITVSVSDARYEADLPTFSIRVNSAIPPQPGEENVAPTLTGTPGITAVVGVNYTFSPVADDANDDPLQFSIVNRPSWATFSQSTGQLSGTPGAGDVGTTSGIVISVSDGVNSTSLTAFSLQVVTAAPSNRPPVISGNPPTTATAGTAYSFRPTASDPDGNTLTYSIQGQPSWASFSTSTGRLSGTPATANIGTTAPITISVSDGMATVSLAAFSIQVSAPPNRAPTISGTPLTSVTVGSAYSFQPTAADADGNTLSFSINTTPSWATFNQSTGRLSGTPGAGDVGSTTGIVISVSDGTASASLPAFSLNVLQAANGTATVTWVPPTTNTDGSALTNLAGYRVAYGRSSSALDTSANLNNPGLTSYIVSNLASGQWFFAVYAVNSSGVESSISNIATRTIP